MDEELKQIREDGFNSIILVVPWREFQPSMAPEHYNDYAWEKFDRVMKAAKAQDLKVMLRVGYTWDYYSSENVLARYEKLLYDSETKKAWLHYAKRLYEKASAYDNFSGGFITWEDFWNFAENGSTLLWKRDHRTENGSTVRLYPVCKRTLYIRRIGEIYRDTF